MANKHKARRLLLAQMQRVMDLLHEENILEQYVQEDPNRSWKTLNRNTVELKRKLREIRRDSIRLEKYIDEN